MITELIKACMEFEVKTGYRPMVSMTSEYFNKVCDSEKQYIDAEGFIEDEDGEYGIVTCIPFYIDNEQSEDYKIKKLIKN